MTVQPDLKAPTGRPLNLISTPVSPHASPGSPQASPEAVGARTPLVPVHDPAEDSTQKRVHPPHESRLGRIAYAIAEVAFAATVLLVTAPIMLAVGLYIKRGTPGPALFRQQRLGRDGKPFTFLKFRTMYVDARERFPELYAYDYSEEEVEKLKFKLTNDPRVTPEGRWLRKSSLDELPNFWNVLTRDMALVGPRPEIPEMLPYYDDRRLAKFLVRPGVTGYSQTRGRGDLGFLETVDLDLQYIEERTPWTDIKTIFRTVWMILRRDGAF